MAEHSSDQIAEERALVSLAASGDTSAFKQLYHRNVGRVYGVCFRIIADEHKAEELTQEVFIQAWEKLPGFRGESLFSTWLHRIAVNFALVAIRTQKRYDTRVETTEEIETFDRIEERIAPETVLDLESAIAKLPPSARAIFVLHDIEGYRHEEIAEQLGVVVGTSKAQLHRARMMLRKAIER